MIEEFPSVSIDPDFESLENSTKLTVRTKRGEYETKKEFQKKAREMFLNDTPCIFYK